MRQTQAQVALQLLCLLLTLVFSGVAIGGVSRGWALASKHDFHQFSPFSPPIELRIMLGWWNATSSLSAQGLPSFEIETKGAKAWGAITIAFIAAADVWVVYLLVALVYAQCGREASTPLSITKRQEFMASLLFTCVLMGLHCVVPAHPRVHCRFAVLLCSVGLYIGLAVGLDHEISKNFSGQHVFARPDWACAAALLAGACLGGVTTITAGAMQYSEHYYSPLIM